MSLGVLMGEEGENRGMLDKSGCGIDLNSRTVQGIEKIVKVSLVDQPSDEYASPQMWEHVFWTLYPYGYGGPGGSSLTLEEY